MHRIVCPRCGKDGTLRDWKDGHGHVGPDREIYHKKRWNDHKPNRCYIDPLTSKNIKTDIGMEQQQQQKLF